MRRFFGFLLTMALLGGGVFWLPYLQAEPVDMAVLILTGQILVIFLVISSEICSTAVTAKAAVSAAMAHMSISPVTVAAFTVDLAEVAFTVATASADSINRIFRKKALM